MLLLVLFAARGSWLWLPGPLTPRVMPWSADTILPATEGRSSIGRAPVSKTGGCRFKSCRPCSSVQAKTRSDAAGFGGSREHDFAADETAQPRLTTQAAIAARRCNSASVRFSFIRDWVKLTTDRPSTEELKNDTENHGQGGKPANFRGACAPTDLPPSATTADQPCARRQSRVAPAAPIGVVVACAAPTPSSAAAKTLRANLPMQATVGESATCRVTRTGQAGAGPPASTSSRSDDAGAWWSLRTVVSGVRGSSVGG